MDFAAPRVIIVDGPDTPIKRAYIDELITQAKSVMDYNTTKNVLYFKEEMLEYAKNQHIEFENGNDLMTNNFGYASMYTLEELIKSLKGNRKVFGSPDMFKYFSLHKRNMVIIDRISFDEFNYSGLREYASLVPDFCELYAGFEDEPGKLEATQNYNWIFKVVYMHVGEHLGRELTPDDEPLEGLSLIAENAIRALKEEHWSVKECRAFMMTQCIRVEEGKLIGYLG